MAKAANEVAGALARGYWREADARAVVKAWRRSGLSQVAFARRHGLSVKRLGRWVRRLERVSEPPRAPASSESPKFHRVRLVGAPESGSDGDAKIEVVVAGAGHTIRLPAGFAPEDLRQVLSVLQEVA